MGVGGYERSRIDTERDGEYTKKYNYCLIQRSDNANGLRECSLIK